MIALNSLPQVISVTSAETLLIPKDMMPGILVLQRQFMDNVVFNDALETLVNKGWLLVSEIDDDPYHWPQYAQSNFYAFRGVHAVTVSNDHLGKIIRQFNPNVQVFENAIFSIPYRLPEKDIVEQNSKTKKLRVFFGALNRKKDWQVMIEGVKQAAIENKHDIEFVVVHDMEFYDELPKVVAKSFFPTQSIEKYTELLASCDIALLPLNDTPFNNCKSDIKLIECAAAQVAVICSETVYNVKPEHKNFVVFASTPEDWREAIRLLVRDNGFRNSNIENAFSYVKSFRMHSQQVTSRLSFYSSLIRNKIILEQQRQQRKQDMVG
jgi:glycosyltransferase involved in cell wall biosynthesis